MPRLARPSVLIVLLACLVAFGPLSIDMYLPSLPTIAADLDAPEAQIQLTVSVFLAGLSLGMLIYGPLSDRFGRRRLLLGGITLYLFASLGCILAGSAEQLIGFRLLQALGGAAASVLARAVVRDVFPVERAASILSLMHLVTMLATLAAPLLGSYLMLWTSWRALFLVLLVFSAICLLWTALKIPETLPADRRSDDLGKAFGAYRQLLGEPKALGFILCMGLVFGGMFAFITASPFVYIRHFGVSEQQYGLLFGLNIFSIIVMTSINARWVGRFGPRKMLNLGAALAAISGVAFTLFGSTGLGGLLPIVICALLYVSVTGMLGANCLALLLANFPKQAGAAAGVAVAMQFGLGMLFSALVSALYDGTPRPMSVIMGIAGVGCFLACRLACFGLDQAPDD